MEDQDPPKHPPYVTQGAQSPSQPLGPWMLYEVATNLPNWPPKMVFQVNEDIDPQTRSDNPSQTDKLSLPVAPPGHRGNGPGFFLSLRDTRGKRPCPSWFQSPSPIKVQTTLTDPLLLEPLPNRSRPQAREPTEPNHKNWFYCNRHIVPMLHVDQHHPISRCG